MNSSPRLLLAAIIVTVPVVAVGWPADEVRVTGFLTRAKQDSPLQILGFKLPEKVGHGPRVVVRNVSSQLIVDFTIRTISAKIVEDTVAGDQLAKMIFLGSATRSLPNQREERSVSPGVVVETLEESLGSHVSVVAAMASRSNCIHTLAMVNRVEFASGTVWEWSASEEQLRQIWKESIVPGSLGSCDGSPKATKLMEQLQGASYIVRDSFTHADTAIVQHYSISCALRPRQGRLFAVCPM
jgi:hypothetical protein